MTTFNVQDHPRAAAGTFTEKTGSAPDAVLTAPASPAFDDLRETLDEMDAVLAAQPHLSRDEWLRARERSQKTEQRLFTDALLATDHGYSRGVFLDGQNDSADALFDLQAERGLAYAADYKARFTDKEDTAARQRAEGLAKLAAVKRQRKIAEWNDAADHGYLDSRVAENLIRLSSPSTTAEQLAEYALIDHDQIIDQVVEHPNVSTETLAKLSTKSPNAALYAARRDDCPASLLAELAGNQHESIQVAVAGHPKTPAATLRGMAKGWEPGVFEALANNPSSGRATLKKLADGSGQAHSVIATRRLRELDAQA